MGGQFIKNNIKRIVFSVIGGVFLSLFFYNFVKAIPPLSPYLPGETLDPNCSPGDPNCTVLPSLTGTSTPGNISFYTGTTTLSGDTELFWDNINKRLGVGTSTPVYKLDVAGNLRVIGQTIFGGVAYTWPSSAGSSGQVLTTDGTGNLSWTSAAGGVSGGGILNYLARWTASTTLGNSIIYDDGTNVGIGTTAPSEKLHIIGNALITGTGTFQSSPLTIGNLVLSHTGLTASRTFTFPDISDTLVSLTATQTLTNKTLGVGSTWQGNIISTQYGGTGLSSIGTANQILGVNAGGTSLEYKNITSLLTAGTGISITGTTNATIANTGILSLTAGPGISISSGQNPTITNLGVLSLNSATGTLTLQGTPNQVNVNTSGNTITLSTPQDIHTGASPTFAGLTLSSLTPGSVLFAGSGGIISQNNSKFFWDNTNFRLGIGTSTPAGILHVATGTINALVVHNTGNVGIGTTTPSQKLTVAGNIGIQAGANAFIGTLDNYALSLRTNNTDRIFITNTGNVGIGTTTPATLLQVVGTTTARTILPEADNFYSLGAPGFRWANIYAATGTFGSTIIIGSNTIQGSSTTTLFTTGNPNQLVLGLDGSINIGGNITGTGNLTITGTTTLSTTTISRLTISEIQKGSILFAGDNGLISQDNTNLFWDNTNKRLGIGTSSPQYTLDLVGTLRAGNTTLEGGSLIWGAVSSLGSAYSVAVDSTGIYVVGYDNIPGNYEWRIEKRNLNDGSVIWATTTNPTIQSDVAYSVAVDSTGIYVVGGDYTNQAGIYSGRWRIEKRNLNDGSVIWATTTDFSINIDIARSVTVDNTGVYIVGNDASPGGLNNQWRIEKRNLNDGSLIWSVTSNPSDDNDVPYSVAVDSTGIYVVGYDSSPGSSNSQWRIEKRSTSTGALIWYATSNPSSGYDSAQSVAVDSTGIYVVGSDSSPGNSQWRIEKRSLNDGSLIWSVTSNPSSASDWAQSVAVDSTGIYIVGVDSIPGNYEWRIEKRNLNDGSLIWSVTSNPSSGYDEPYSVAVDSSGIYVVGYDYAPGNYQWRIEKRRKYDENKPLFTAASNNNILSKLDVLGTALIRGAEGNTGLYVNEYGYVGIGTNNPSNLIEVKDLIKFLGTNTFLGYQSGYSNTTGGYNVGIGYQALYSNTTGGYNVGIGYQALYSNLSGGNNIAIGYSALRYSTSSSYNVAIGVSALYSNTTGQYNTAIGHSALSSNTTGQYNVGIGTGALSYNTTGQYNIGIGNYALFYNQSGSANVVMGYNAGQGAYGYSYSSSTIIGYQAGFLNRGSGNILIGYQAGDNITTGNRNIIIGYDIDAPSSTASYQLNIGNIIFGTNINGIGTTISSGNIGIGTTTPTAKLHVFGSTTLGASTSTPINFVGYVNSNIIPFSDNVYTLGAPGFRWANIYAATGTFGSTIIIGSNTIQGSSTTTLFTTGNPNQLVLGLDGSINIGGNITGTGNLTITGTTTLATTTISRLTISEIQKGSILFAGDNGLISQDNSNLFWDNTNKRLGIGTSSPQYTLDLVGTLRAGNTILEGGSLIWWSVSNPSSGNDIAYSVAVDSTGIYVVGVDRIHQEILNGE
jgi:hypothetical protein